MAAHHQPPVLYIITKLELGGAQKVCLSLFHEMQKAGSTTFLISGKEGLLVEEVKDLPNVFLLDTLKREVRIKDLWLEVKTFFAIIKILRALKKKHPNIIVHTHGSKAGVLGRLASLFAGIKKRIHTVHGFAFHNHQSAFVWSIMYLIELLCAPLTHHFICVSSTDVATGSKCLPRFKKNHSLIRAAINTEHFYVPSRQATPFPDHETPFIFGAIVCFKAQKNIFDTLKAFKSVYNRNPFTRLEIIGDGDLRPEIEDWIRKNALQEAVILHGWQKDVVPILRKWHCFVLTSLWEGLPCALIEARLTRIPIVCYDTGGIRDVVHHGVNGFIYPQHDWQQMAKGMLGLSLDELLFITVRHYPDNLAEFSIPVMINKHQQLYNAP